MKRGIEAPTWWHNPSVDKLDRRTRRTREALYGALMALLHDRPLSNITVTELTNLADVNRSTFYAHFQDIYDMVDTMRSDFKAALMQVVLEQADGLRTSGAHGFMRSVYGYFRDNREMFSVVFGQGPNEAFFGDVVTVVRAGCMDAWGDLAGERGVRDEEQRRALEYRIEFAARGAVGMARAWIEGGCKEDVAWMVDQTDALLAAVRDAG